MKQVILSIIDLRTYLHKTCLSNFHDDSLRQETIIFVMNSIPIINKRNKLVVNCIKLHHKLAAGCLMETVVVLATRCVEALGLPHTGTGRTDFTKKTTTTQHCHTYCTKYKLTKEVSQLALVRINSILTLKV